MLTFIAPQIFVAHGTSITPFISVLEHFKYLLDSKVVKSIGSIEIYYGIHRFIDNQESTYHKNYLFSDKISELLDYFKSTCTSDNTYQIHICESRSETSNNMYVQDLILENIEDFKQKFEQQEALLYVCGNGHTMVKDLEKVLNENIQR